MDLLEPQLKIKCKKKVFTLGPTSWKSFAYFRLFMHYRHQTSTICFDQTFTPFLKLLNNQEMQTYEEIVALREQLLILGMDSVSSMATRANLLIARGLHLISTQNVIWDMIQLGWNEFIPETGTIFGHTFIRQNRITRILLTALLPLKGYTIDILNSETLETLKKKDNTELNEKENELKTLIQDLFDKSKAISTHPVLFTYE